MARHASAAVVILPICWAAASNERERLRWERLSRQEKLSVNRDNIIILPVIRFERYCDEG